LFATSTFEPLYLGHPKVAYYGEAEYREWGNMPNGLDDPIGEASLMEYFYDISSFGDIYYKPPGEEPRPLFESFGHDGRDHPTVEYLRDLWIDRYSRLEDRKCAFLPSEATEIKLFDGTIVNEDIPGYYKSKQSKLFNHVFWFEQVEMEETVESEGNTYIIDKIQNVGLGYLAVPSELLAYVVDRMRKSISPIS